jgi:hypothetical protein
MSEQLQPLLTEKIEKTRKSGINESIYFVPFRDKMLSLRTMSNLHTFKQEKNLPGLKELELAVDSQLNILIPKLSILESDIETKILLGENVDTMIEKKDLAQTQIDTIFEYKEKLLPIIRDLEDEREGSGPNPLRAIFPRLSRIADRLVGKK